MQPISYCFNCLTDSPSAVPDSRQALRYGLFQLFGCRLARLPPVGIVWRSKALQAMTRLVLDTADQLFVAATYRGCAEGWVANGSARSFSDARRLSSLIARIRPEKITRPVAV